MMPANKRVRKLARLHELDLEPYSPEPEDILCAPVERVYDSLEDFKRRVKALATGYINGYPLVIFSASLRGPFTNNWLNTWSTSATRKRKGKEALEGRERVRLERFKKRRQEQLERERVQKALRADGRGKSAELAVCLTDDEETRERREKVRLERFEKRRQEQLERESVQKALRADGRGKSAELAVCLTDDEEEESPGLTISSSFSSGMEAVEEHLIEPVIEPLLYGRAPSEDHPAAVRPDEAPPEHNEDDLDLEEHGKPDLVFDRQDLPQHADSLPSARTSSRANGSRDPTPGIIRPTVDLELQHDTVLVDTTVLGRETDGRYDHEMQKEPTSIRGNMPTPSESGEEEDSALVPNQEQPRTDAEEAPVIPKALSPGLYNGFTAVNQAWAAQKQRPRPDGILPPSDVSAPVPTQIVQDIDDSVKQNGVLHQATTIAAVEEVAKCAECDSELPRRRRLASALCVKCRKRASRREKKAAIPKAQQSENETGAGMESAKLPPSQRTLRSNRPPPHLSMSQPEPKRTRFELSPSRHMPPSSSLPLLNSLQSLSSHQTIMGRMLSDADSKELASLEKQLEQLMGPRQEWTAQVISSEQTKECASDAGDTLRIVDVVVPAKQKPRPMKFDTPVFKREQKRLRKAEDDTETTNPEIKEAPNPEVLAGEERCDTGLVVLAETIAAPQTKIRLGTDATRTGGEPQTTKTPIRGMPQELPNNANPLLERDAAFMRDGTPRSQSRKLLDMNMNKVFTAEEGIRFRKLARISAGIFEDIPDLSSPQMQKDLGTQDESPPYVSTQIAMLEAQQAFQECLDSPATSKERVWNDDADTEMTICPDSAKTCNITPFHALHHNIGIEGKSGISQVGANPSTQAIFDAAMNDALNATPDSSTTQSGKRKRASFDMTPIGPQEDTPVSSARAPSSKKGTKGVLQRSSLSKRVQKSSTSQRNSAFGTPLSNLGLGVLNAPSSSDQADMEQCYKFAESFLSD